MNHRSPRIAMLAVVLSLSSLLAQDPTQAKTYAPNEYDYEVRIDFPAVLDSGAWDVLEHSLARVLFEMFRRQRGFALTDLTSFRIVGKNIVGNTEPQFSNMRSVFIFEGNSKVSLDKADMSALLRSKTEEEIGSYRLFSNSYDSYTSPREGLVVSGTPGLLREALSGDKQNAIPCEELLRITAGPRPMVDMTYIFPDGWLDDPLSSQMMPKGWFETSAPPTIQRITLSTVDKSDHLVAVLQYRFKQAGEGPERLAAGAKKSFADLQTNRTLKIFWGLFSAIEVENEDTDVTMKLDLGAEGEHLALLTHLYAHMTVHWNFSAPRQMAQVELVEEEEAESAAAAKPGVADKKATEKKSKPTKK